MDLEAFWLYVDIREPDECWLWTRGNAAGYGWFAHAGKQYYAHRFAFEYFKGPTQLYVLHSCDNPLCCNPGHLYAGTQKQNMADKLSRGRANMPRGESHGHSKVTSTQVQAIRALAESGYGQRELGRIFNLSHKGIAYILKKGWRHEDQREGQDSSRSHA